MFLVTNDLLNVSAFPSKSIKVGIFLLKILTLCSVAVASRSICFILFLEIAFTLIGKAIESRSTNCT
jgi:hypothetical protein